MQVSKFNLALNITVLSMIALFLCGCATSDYVGSDYNSDNVQTVKTNEEFVFKTYSKKTDNAVVKMGISRSPVPEILALFVQVENLSYETPYTFRVEDLNLKTAEGSDIKFITTGNYLNIYQGQEASSMASMQTFGATIQNMSGVMGYNEYNQSIAQNNSQETNKSAFSRLETIGNSIAKHSIKVSSVISPRKSQYFYFFFEDLDEFPILVKYKNLSYSFKI